GSTSAEWLRNKGETYSLTKAARLKVLSEFDTRGYGHADYEQGSKYGNYKPGSGYGISIASRARIVEMTSGVGEWTFSSFFERGWSDHHDVYAFTKGQTKAPLIVEARGPVPDPNMFRWTL